MARTNMRFGISLLILLMATLGATFLWASIYLSVVK